MGLSRSAFARQRRMEDGWICRQGSARNEVLVKCKASLHRSPYRVGRDV